jgi:hypothetical protein
VEFEAPEATSLTPAERVRAILGRGVALFGESVAKETRVSLDELRGVPGYERELLALVTDTRSELWSSAIAALAWLHPPQTVEHLMAFLDRPPPPDPDLHRETKGSVATDEDDAYDKARDTFMEARHRLVWVTYALAQLDDPSAATRLGALLFGSEPPPVHQLLSARPILGAIFRQVVRAGRPEDTALLAQLDERTANPQGWGRICQYRIVIESPISSAHDNPCATGKDTERDAAFVVVNNRSLWARRRRSDGGLGPPMLVSSSQQGLPYDSMGGTAEDGRFVIRLGGKVVFSMPLADLLRDSDGDGVTDATEAYLGTDPKRADTDGDGIPDLEDPSPMGAVQSEAAAALAQATSYLMLFETGTAPLVVQAPKEYWGQAPRPPGLVLHVANRADAKLPNLSEWVVEVKSVEVNGGTAEVHFAKGLLTRLNVVRMVRLGGVWRVTGLREEE